MQEDLIATGPLVSGHAVTALPGAQELGLGLS